MNLLRIAIIALLGIGVVLGFMLAATVKGWAHTAPSGWEYPDECCRDHNDCHMVPASRVHVEPNGYRIVLRPGDHPHVPGGGEFFFPFQIEIQGKVQKNTSIKQSGDSDYHACIGLIDIGPVQRCLYIPPGLS